MKRLLVKLLCGSWLCWLALLAATPARALDIPPASSAVSCQTFGGIVNDPVFCQSQQFDAAQVTFAPFASTSSIASYPGGFASVPAGADAHLAYSWAFVGGTPGDLLHIDIELHLAVTSFGNINARGFASVISTTVPSGQVQVCVETTGLCGSGATHSFDGVMQVLARSGDVNTLFIQSSASGLFSADSNGSTAFADPHIFLDPAFPTSTSYELVLSTGIGNATAPVPEPGGALLFAVGLAGLALLKRR